MCYCLNNLENIRPRVSSNIAVGSKEEKQQKLNAQRVRRIICSVLLCVLLVSNIMISSGYRKNAVTLQVLSLSLPGQMSLFERDSYTLVPQVETAGNDIISYDWSSDSPETVRVGPGGVIDALAPGNATITVTELSSGLTAQCLVTVIELGDLMLSSAALFLGEGETGHLTATDGSSDVSLTLTSSDPAVVTVNEDGSLSALARGTATLSVEAVGFEPVTCEVTVNKAPSSISFDMTTKICAGESRKLSVAPGEGSSCSTYTYASHDPDIITIEDGVMTAVAKGTAEITATAYNGVAVTQEIKVVSAPVSVKFAKEKYSVYTGVQVPLSVKDNTGACRLYGFTSSDPSIITVSPEGVVTAVGKGTATITCESYNGVSATCKVTADVVDSTTPYTSRRVLENISQLAAAYPDLISTEVIGHSSKGTDITLLKMGKGEKKACIIGGLHAREHITINFVMRCIEEYAEVYYSTTGKYGTFNLRNMLDEYTLYFVPMLNPDGLDICTDSQPTLYSGEVLYDTELKEFKNTATGVNLNRNFPFMWGVESVNTTTPDLDSYAGTHAGSEPEAQAIITLCAENAFEWLYSIHVQGGMVYWQDSYNEDAEKAQKLANRLSVNCDLDLMRASSLSGISGGLENWFRAEYKKPGFCIELIDDKYSTTVNEYFELKTNWKKTRYLIVLGMLYG